MSGYLYLFLTAILLSATTARTQSSYWQQEANFRIQVELNEREHTLDGKVDLSYVNHSPDTLTSIWIHVWPNAYRTDKTAFSDQLLENGRTEFYFSDQEERGYINRLDFHVDQKRAVVKDHPQHIDILELILNEPLYPGDSCLLSTPFHLKLPKNVSRGGYNGNSFQVTQWYPKPAVYDKTGWHPYPYLEQGEFYSEFGNYEVTITVPAKYQVFTSGILKEESISSGNETKRSQTFIQKNIHDFAWFADPNLTVLKDTVQLSSEKIVELTAAFRPASEKHWKNSIAMMKKVIRFRSQTIGAYAYTHCTAVEAPMGFEGGMEYPCITAITPVSSEAELESVLGHEIGHNWFQGMLGSDERRFPWLDEGINSYYDQRYASSTGSGLQATKMSELLLATLEKTKKDQPLSTSSEKFSQTNYFNVSYTKGALFMKQLESVLGRDLLDKGMQLYFERWRFKHPYPEDLQRALEESSGTRLDSLFGLLTIKGSILPSEKQKLKLGIPFRFHSEGTHSVNIFPAAGFNMYDGIMLGTGISNYSLPPSRFQFLIAPLFGTKSKTWNGAGRLSYTSYPDSRWISEIRYSAGWMKFTKSDFTDSAGSVYRTGFSRLSPSVRLTLKEKDPRSSRERTFQWRTFFIDEERLLFKRDTLPNGNAFTNIGTESRSRYLNQFRYIVKNTRALYPYSAEWMAEQTRDFLRLSFTGNYYFNFNEKQGASVRLFAGKFMYFQNPSISTRFRNQRYHLNMTGPKGEEDYTYSHYFFGRNEFDGWASQQIALRDGAFKVRTDLLADKVGQTDNWLIALNMVSNIPDQINILNILPVKIPIKAYLDLGTYAEAWTPKAEGSKILYNAGLQLSLLKESVQVYIPLFYSKVYRDYFQSTFPEKRFWKTISFIIDLQRLNPKTVDPSLPF